MTEPQYEELVRAKTGSLIGAATEIGAGLNGGGSDARRRLRYRRFGERIGVAFQIVDDLFDYLSEPEVTGKPVGYDLAEGKVTLPLIAALRSASQSERRALRALASRKRWTQGQWARLRELIDRSGGFEYARTRALALAAEAREMLRDDRLPGAANGSAAGPNAARRALDRAIDYAIERQY